VAEALVVLEAEEVAVPLHLAVVGKEFPVDLPRHERREVAELGAQLDAAAREQLRRDGGVVVLGEVHVVRQREVESALRGGAERGSEEARLAPVVQRERQERRIEDRQPEEEHGRVVRSADVAGAVDLHFAHADEPVVARHRA
jgi:hypothetical protein